VRARGTQAAVAACLRVLALLSVRVRGSEREGESENEISRKRHKNSGEEHAPASRREKSTHLHRDGHVDKVVVHRLRLVVVLPEQRENPARQLLPGREGRVRDAAGPISTG